MKCVTKSCSWTYASVRLHPDTNVLSSLCTPDGGWMVYVICLHSGLEIPPPVKDIVVTPAWSGAALCQLKPWCTFGHSAQEERILSDRLCTDL